MILTLSRQHIGITESYNLIYECTNTFVFLKTQNYYFRYKQKYWARNAAYRRSPERKQINGNMYADKSADKIHRKKRRQTLQKWKDNRFYNMMRLYHDDKNNYKWKYRNNF